MINLSHPQLDPSINRTRRVSGGLADLPRTDHTILQPEVDPKNPYYPVHTGLFDGFVTDEAGARRDYLLYIPTTMKTSGNSMLVFIPGGKKARDFFLENSWKDSLEKHAIATYFVEAPNGWRLSDPGFEIDTATKVLGEMRSMEYFSYNAPGNYAMGFGDGANIASVFAVMHISALSGFAAWGNIDINEELLNKIGSAPSDCDVDIQKNAVELPAFLIEGEGTDGSGLTEFFKKANSCRDDGLCNGFAHVYRAYSRPDALYLNKQPHSEVWHSSTEDIAGLTKDDVIEKMVAFVANYKHGGSDGNASIRLTQRPEDIGLLEKNVMIDGLLRRYHMFEPTAYKRGNKKKYPLVFAIHGFSCSGPFFAENSGWHSVAEERGFLVCYPTAYPFKRSGPPKGHAPGPFDRNICATPSWNSGRYAVEADPAGPDDVAFFKQMLELIKKEYPVDETRVYLAGHSNGAAMTQRLMRYAPELFAAFSPVGGMEGMRGVVPEPDDGYTRPVWYFMGEYDRSGMYLEEGGANLLTVQNLCDSNKLDYAKRRFYTSGQYEHTVVKDDEGRPLVRFTGIVNFPHTYTPEIALLTWDEFFCRYVRNKDGSVTYLG